MPKLVSANHKTIAATTAPGFYSWEGKPGFFLRVTKTGARCWMYRTRAGGVARWVNLGDATTTSFTQADAKAAVLRAESLKARGQAPTENPIERARAEKRAAAARKRKAAQDEALKVTLDQLAEQYLGVFVAEKRRRTGEKRWKDAEQRIYHREIAPRLGASKVEDIRAKDVAAMRNAIKSDSAKRKAVAILRALLSHAKSDGLIDHNPALGIKTQPSGKRARVLTDDEITAIWRATSLEGVRPAMLAAVKVQLATGQRAGEVLAMRWSDLREEDGRRHWVVPPEIAKNGREHLVPLSPQACELIDAQRPPSDQPPEKASAYVFPARASKTRAKPITASNYAHVVDAVRAALKLEHFTSHDLRRSAATRMAQGGTLPHVIEAVLNHVSGAKAGVAGIYNVHSYFHEARTALNRWVKRLDDLAAGKNGRLTSTLVAFPKRMATQT